MSTYKNHISAKIKARTTVEPSRGSIWNYFIKRFWKLTKKKKIDWVAFIIHRGMSVWDCTTVACQAAFSFLICVFGQACHQMPRHVSVCVSSASHTIVWVWILSIEHEISPSSNLGFIRQPKQTRIHPPTHTHTAGTPYRILQTPHEKPRLVLHFNVND